MRCNLFTQGAVALVVLCADQQAAGVLVDAVDNALPLHTVAGGELSLAVKEQGVDQRPLLVARAGVHHHVFGFVDHQQMLVLVDDVQRDLLRLRQGGWVEDLLPVRLAVQLLRRDGQLY